MSTANSRTILVTGAAGFIGRHTCNGLREAGLDVRAVDKRAAEGVVPLDLADLDQAFEAVGDTGAVVHLAAMASVPRSIREPAACHRDTLTTTVNLLTACRELNVRRFVYASSAGVYGDHAGVQHEDDMPGPRSPYAAAKLAGEAYVRAFSSFGVDGVSLRYFNVYGPGQDAHSDYAGVVRAFAERVRMGEPMTLYGDGEQTRDFIHVNDVVRANLLALESDAAFMGACLNIATGESVSIRRLGNLFAEAAGAAPAFETREERRGDIRHSRADVSKARRMLGFSAEVPLTEGLQGVLADVRGRA